MRHSLTKLRLHNWIVNTVLRVLVYSSLDNSTMIESSFFPASSSPKQLNPVGFHITGVSFDISII